MRGKSLKSREIARAARPLLPLSLLSALLLTGCATTVNQGWGEAPGQSRAQSASAGLPVTNFILHGDHVYFDTDRWTLSQTGKAALDRQVEWLTRYPQVAVRIEGNADERGTSTHNAILGRNRAQAVRLYLVTRGIPASRLTIVSNGENKPQDPGASPAALASNRNAQTIVITAGGR
jgi:outer membrane protein OmpA-like peptidoglycan-associated protein